METEGIRKSEKTAIIYLSAHGAEYDEPAGIPVGIDIELLSFAGSPGLYGYMTKCNGISLHHLTLDFLRYFYKDNALDFERGFREILPEFLRDMYSECDINYKDNGFNIESPPPRKRLFQFYPGAHEDCIKCEQRGDQRCVSQRQPLQKFSPYYGFVVVASSYPEDSDFTLANSGKPIERMNLLDDYHLITRNYWLERAGLNTKDLDEYTPTTKRVKTELKVEVEPELVEAARSIFNKKLATLAEIVQFFKAMGFEKLLILDPTCRYFDIPEFESYSQDPNTKTYSEDRASEFTRAYYDISETAKMQTAKMQTLEEFVKENLKHWQEYKQYKIDIINRGTTEPIDFKTFLEKSKTWSHYFAGYSGILRKLIGRGGKTRRGKTRRGKTRRRKTRRRKTRRRKTRRRTICKH